MLCPKEESEGRCYHGAVLKINDSPLTNAEAYRDLPLGLDWRKYRQGRLWHMRVAAILGISLIKAVVCSFHYIEHALSARESRGFLEVAIKYSRCVSDGSKTRRQPTYAGYGRLLVFRNLK